MDLDDKTPILNDAERGYPPPYEKEYCSRDYRRIAFNAAFGFFFVLFVLGLLAVIGVVVFWLGAQYGSYGWDLTVDEINYNCKTFGVKEGPVRSADQYELERFEDVGPDQVVIMFGNRRYFYLCGPTIARKRRNAPRSLGGGNARAKVSRAHS